MTWPHAIISSMLEDYSNLFSFLLLVEGWIHNPTLIGFGPQMTISPRSNIIIFQYSSLFWNEPNYTRSAWHGHVYQTLVEADRRPKLHQACVAQTRNQTLLEADRIQ